MALSITYVGKAPAVEELTRIRKDAERQMETRGHISWTGSTLCALYALRWCEKRALGYSLSRCPKRGYQVYALEPMRGIE